jgi:hypothetical protein
VLECLAAVITMKLLLLLLLLLSHVKVKGTKSQRHFEDLTGLSPTTHGSSIINHPPFAEG